MPNVIESFLVLESVVLLLIFCSIFVSKSRKLKQDEKCLNRLKYRKMAQLTIQVQDSKVPFFMELIKNFDFVKIDFPTKEEVKDNIRKGLTELQLIEQGKMQATTLKDFLNEL